MSLLAEVANARPQVLDMDLSASPAWPTQRVQPFHVEVFEQRLDAYGRDARNPEDFHSLMPAMHRTKQDDLLPATPTLDFLQSEFCVDKIIAIQDWLWVCGRPMPPRPLHYQVMLSREIFITENPHLHLVWGSKRMFLKPLPKYLLDKKFWKMHILHETDEELRKVEECARGFLFSYCALIAYESDFRIAKEKGLVPDKLTWETWRQVSAQFLDGHSYSTVSPRYYYGELRLGRLNMVYRLTKFSIFRGYSRATGHAVYGDLIQDNLTALASILGYVVIVLTALQVGLATDKLGNDKYFQRASYGFTVLSILAPLIVIAGILLFVVVWIFVNRSHTLKYEKKRFQTMGVVPLRQKAAEEKKALVGFRETTSGEA